MSQVSRPSRWIARLLLLAVLAGGAGGCAVFEPEPRDAERRALDEARARWVRQGLARYEFVYTLRCGGFCHEEFTQPAVVTVTDGAVETVRYVRGGQPSAIANSYWPTVERLFAQIEDAYARNAALVRVRYDAQLGYPIDAVIDYDRGIADDELEFSVSGMLPR